MPHLLAVGHAGLDEGEVGESLEGPQATSGAALLDLAAPAGSSARHHFVKTSRSGRVVNRKTVSAAKYRRNLVPQCEAVYPLLKR